MSSRRLFERSSRAAAALIATLAVLASLADSALAGTYPGGNGLIAFTSSRDGDVEIYLMNPDGTGQRRLTNSPGSDSQPSWSPDGTRIAFTSLRDGNPRST